MRRPLREQRSTVTDDDLAAALALLREPDVMDDLGLAQVRATVGVGHALLLVVGELRRVRAELAALRLS
jgi:multisubunit Na+/H+ antiporter MnhG subunit